MTDGHGTKQDGEAQRVDRASRDGESSPVPACRHWHVIRDDDLADLLSEHADLRSLCSILEHCADCLPVRPSARDADWICARLALMTERCDDGLEPTLDTLFRRTPSQPLIGVLLDHVAAHRATDAVYAQDLIVALDPRSIEADRFAPDMLGYMLRCFFDGCRRATDFTELSILTLGHARLTRAARMRLIDSLARRTSP